MRIIHTLLFLTVLTYNCTSSKDSTTKPTNELEIEKPTDFLELGYKKAVIKDFSSETGCGFLIVLEKNQQVLQPLKPLDNKFNKQGISIWVKYRPIRPTAPKCKKGQLVDLEDIQLR